MKRSNIVIIVLVLVTLFLTGCTGGGGGKPQDYSVSGKIVDSNGNGIPNVTLGFSGSFGVATTDNNGKWSKVGLNGNVTITPVKDGWTFETKKVTKADSNVNFIGIRRTYPVVVTTSGEGKVNQEVAVSASSTQYEHGTQVQLTAVPETGWRFSHWEGDLTGSTNPATILVDSEKSITAVFVKMEYALNISIQGEGTVNEDVVISALSTEYEHGTQVQLTAVPETGWRFSHWEGDLEGSTNPAMIVVDSEKSVTAVFVKMEYAFNIAINGWGLVARDPDQAIYHYGDSVVLETLPGAGWAFSGWSGDLSGDDSPVSLLVDSDKSITANFLQVFDLSLTTEGGGTASVDGDQSEYLDGSLVTITATAAEGWYFDRWEGNLTGSENPATIVMDDDKNIKAVFLQKEYALNIYKDGNGTVSKEPTQETYTHGSIVELSATSADGWKFDGWTGDFSGNANPVSVTINDDMDITAVFVFSIQAAIDLAQDGDTIVVPQGTYYENIDFMGKNVKLQSSNPQDLQVVNSTIIDGRNQGAVVLFNKGESREAVLSGFTIMNGSGRMNKDGGGIYVYGSSPTIRNNIIQQNVADYGGAIYAKYAAPLIEYNVVKYNDARTSGGGIYIERGGSDVVISGNDIIFNAAGIQGGGLYIEGRSDDAGVRTCTVSDNVIEGNSATCFGGGIWLLETGSGHQHHLLRNTFVNNYVTYVGSGLYYGGGAVYLATHTAVDIQENTFESNSSADIGGAILTLEGRPNLTNNVFINNHSNNGGGALYLDDWVGGRTRALIAGNQFLGNSTVNGGGGAILVGQSSSIITLEGDEWIRLNAPPSDEPTNTYSGNTVNNEEGVSGANVYFY